MKEYFLSYKYIRLSVIMLVLFILSSIYRFRYENTNVYKELDSDVVLTALCLGESEKLETEDSNFAQLYNKYIDTMSSAKEDIENSETKQEAFNTGIMLGVLSNMILVDYTTELIHMQLHEMPIVVVQYFSIIWFVIFLITGIAYYRYYEKPIKWVI